MKHILKYTLSSLLLATFLSSCNQETISTEQGSSSKNSTGEKTSSADTSNASSSTSSSSSLTISKIPDSIQEIPSDYKRPASEKGTLEELYYDTYESFSYGQGEKSLRKRAVIYLPYGYSSSTKYDVFYYMHGGWSNETTTLGTPGKETSFKNVIDNAIENKESRPLIIVCPTYNNTNENGQDSDNFSLALQLTRNYHNELIHDLIPAVESKYSTYASSTSEENLKKSRDHRGFGGFSMGSVTTWRTFQYALDYFHDFLPMSCGTTLDDEEIFRAAEGRDKSDYFVFMMTGTSDFAYSYEQRRVSEIRNSSYFKEGDDRNSGNFAYRIKDGYSHDGRAASEYTYNGMKFFYPAVHEDAPIQIENHFNENSLIEDVKNEKVFSGHGRLLFPANEGYYSGRTLAELQLTWYTEIRKEKTVEIVNTLYSYAKSGQTIFYDIYSDEEKKSNPAKENTGLFFFRGEENGKVAVCNAGGGFVYVGAMQDSFPHALELSKKGYNAFALIYRPGSETAMEDLARAIAFLHEHQEELKIDMSSYSLWGGSAGARMAATLGSVSTSEYGEKEYPRPKAVIMQYTGFSTVFGNEPATYNCVGRNDSIASYQTMQNRINRISKNGTDTKIEVFDGLRHGFGLGIGTVAEGWLDRAVSFWERNM